MGIPEFYRYQMPETKGLAMQQALHQGIKDAMQRKKDKSELQSADLQRQGFAQKMGEDAERFPLELQQTQATIDQIHSSASLDPFRKQLLIAQIHKALQASNGTGGSGVKAESPMGKALQDAQNATDPETKQKLLKYANSLALTPEEKQAEVARAKDWSKMESSDLALAEGADKSLQALNAFNSAADRVPGRYKGALYVPDDPKNNPIQNAARRVAIWDSGSSYGAAEKFQAQLQLFQQALVKNGSRMNINLLNTLNKSTASLGLPDSARKEVSNSIEMGAKLAKEKVKFNNELKKQGVTDPQQNDELWSNFVDNYPVMGPDNKAIPENLGKWKNIIKNYQGTKTEGEEETEYDETSSSLDNDPLGIR